MEVAINDKSKRPEVGNEFDEEELEDDSFRCGRCKVEHKHVEEFLEHKKFCAASRPALQSQRPETEDKSSRSSANDYSRNRKSSNSQTDRLRAPKPTEDHSVHLTIEVADLPRNVSPSTLSYTLKDSGHRVKVIKKESTQFSESEIHDAEDTVTRAALETLRFEQSLRDENNADYSESDVINLTADERPYKCEVCFKGFKEMAIRRAHMLTHSYVRNFPCPYENCDHSFKTKGSLKRHIRRHTGERPFKCRECGRSFRESGALLRHKKSRTPCIVKADTDLPLYGVNRDINPSSSSQIKLEIIDDQPTESCEDSSEPMETEPVIDDVVPDVGEQLEVNKQPLLQIRCLACNNLFDNKSDLCSHLQEHVKSIPALTCEICSFTACSNKDLQNHFIEQHQDPSEDENGQKIVAHSETDAALAGINIADTDRDLNNSNLTHQQKNEAAVALTQLSDMGYTDNESNIATDSSLMPRNHKCPYCNRLFRGRSYLRLHLRIHTGERPHKCPHCLKGFTTRDALNKHLFVHTEDRQFKCGECGKMFKRISHVKEHLKIHSSERPYECSCCNKRFKTSNACKVHIRTHTSTAPWQCSFCSKSFREKGSLERHWRKHTGSKPYECKHCKRRFSEHGTLNRHLRAKVPCYMNKKRTNTEDDHEMNPEPNVLAEFSSVVADTQRYIIPADNDHNNEAVHTEFVVVDEDASINTEDGSSSYVLVNQGNDEYILIDGNTGKTVSVNMTTDDSRGVSVLELSEQANHARSDDRAVTYTLDRQCDETVTYTTDGLQLADILNTAVLEQVSSKTRDGSDNNTITIVTDSNVDDLQLKAIEQVVNEATSVNSVQYVAVTPTTENNKS
ncbi:uncharacterized protein LOC141903614 [Tubulanus polymorphus]|uniref:uncharacterized protein LOC141903614 n=1 Tax=Tubulanus polymorphus TaxID=672921 RepID=UPI003DA521BC